VSAAKPLASIILVSIDTLRADRLPAYGYAKGSTPAMDGLRRDGLLYEQAYTACPLTLPSHVSLFTGRLPPAHGVRDNIGYRIDGESIPTLARLLRERGFATAAAVSAYVLRGSTGIAAGFDRYDDGIEVEAEVGLGHLERPGPQTVAIALEHLGALPRRPLFFFLHLFEPHAPYSPPEPWRSRHSDPYDGEVAAADAALGAFLDGLRRAGLYDGSLIVLLGDHGEGLGDHGEKEHGILLHRETIRVPLIVKLPGGARGGESVARPVHLVDVLPTIAGVAGLALPAGLPGRSLVDDSDQARRLYSETYYPRLHFGWSGLRSLVDGRFHFIDGPAPELYDVEADPAETRNVLRDHPAVARRLRSELEAMEESLAEPEPVTPREAARLAALGYLSAPVKVASDQPVDPKQGLPALDDLKRAIDLAREGRHPEAVALLEGLIDRFPGMLDGRFALCSGYRNLGRFDDAIECHRRAIAIAPVAANGSLIELARIFLDLGRLDRAEEHARAALEGLPVEGNDVLARVVIARGDAAAAQRHAEAAVAAEILPRAESVILLARTHMLQGGFGEGLALLDEVRSRLQAKNLELPPELEFERGEALANLGRSTEAAAAFGEEIRRYPANADAYTRLAYVHAVRKEFDRIDPLLAAMVEANPRRETYLLAAETAGRLGDEQGRESWLRRANEVE
jgi:arylsulfatase A-like enzyme